MIDFFRGKRIAGIRKEEIYILKAVTKHQNEHQAMLAFDKAERIWVQATKLEMFAVQGD